MSEEDRRYVEDESRRRSVDDENDWPLINEAIDVIVEADPTECPQCHGTRRELTGTSYYGIDETIACTACYGPAYEIAMQLYRVGMLGPKPKATRTNDFLTPTARTLVDTFSRFYLATGVDRLTHWRGVPVWKPPTDLWMYQEIIHETKPDLIIETGTAKGGSALYLSDISNAAIISIDLARFEPDNRADRATYFTGRSSIDPRVVAEVRSLVAVRERVMVVLDSDHAANHVLGELEAYAPLVTPGCYLVVEDTCVNGRPSMPGHGPGPGEALDAWLPAHPEFEVDLTCERFLHTNHPGGWLRRRRP